MVSSIQIQHARKVMRDAFVEEPDFKHSYVANVAMQMYDRLYELGYKPKLRPEDREAVAEAIINLIFQE